MENGEPETTEIDNVKKKSRERVEELRTNIGKSKAAKNMVMMWMLAEGPEAEYFTQFLLKMLADTVVKALVEDPDGKPPDGFGHLYTRHSWRTQGFPRLRR